MYENRWYIQHGDRIEDARASLIRLRDTEQEVEDEILAIREAITFEKEVISGSYLALWKDASVRKRLLLAFIVNIVRTTSRLFSSMSLKLRLHKTCFRRKMIMSKHISFFCTRC